MRIKSLKKTFLVRYHSKTQYLSLPTRPLTFKPDLDRLAAFRLLLHAEIEDYLEFKASSNVASIKDEINKKNRVIDKLDWFVLANFFGKPLKITCPHDLNEFLPVADQILDSSLGFIRKNNGIKSQSFAVLSLLCGKKLAELDDALASSLNAYGIERGNVAHQSVTRVRSINAPSAEEQTARALLTELERYFYH